MQLPQVEAGHEELVLAPSNLPASQVHVLRHRPAGFEDHVSYGCADYRRTVATVLQQIDRDPALVTDDRRVEVDLVHV